jgi:hypothetical protein
VLKQVENNGEDSCVRTEAIFLAMYKWLDKTLGDQGYQVDGGVREALLEAFDIYMVS